MKRRNRLSLAGVVLSAVLAVPGTLVIAQTAPDNTKVNKQDQNTSAPNADNAKNTTSDTKMMAEIRRDVMKDKSLSSYAHNVKIVSRHGKVTLRGPVHTDQEKTTIEQYATKVAGDGNVTNEITVKGDSK